MSGFRRLTTRQMREAYERAALPDPVDAGELHRDTSADLTTTDFVERYRRKAALGVNRTFIINRIMERLWTDIDFFTAITEYAMSARADLLR
jgi:hypothetical protein